MGPESDIFSVAAPSCESEMAAPTVLVVDEPIIDLIMEVDDGLLDRFGLTEGETVHYDPSKHRSLYEVLLGQPSTVALPGGIAQNSARVCQALSHERGRTGAMGAIGKDAYGNLMKQEAERCGLTLDYEEVVGVMTSRCAVLVNSRTKERTMVTHLGASNYLKVEKLDKEKIALAKVIFTGGFMACSHANLVREIATESIPRPDQVWFTSLGAPFVVSKFSEVIDEWIEMANMVVGNEFEWKEYGRVHGWHEIEAEDIVEKVCKAVPWRGGAKKCRMIIATQGSKPVIVAHREGQDADTRLFQFKVNEVPPLEIVDTNGCGDAFLGGFMYGWSWGLPLEKCVKIGQVCGREVLRNTGAVFNLSEYAAKLNQWIEAELGLSISSPTTAEGFSSSDTDSSFSM